MRLREVCLFAAVLLVWVHPGAAQVTTYTWNDTTSSWTTPSAWTPAGPNWGDAQQQINAQVNFAAQNTIANQPVIDNNVNVQAITINNGQTPWNISRSFGALNINQGGITVNGSTQQVTTISANVALATTQTWSVSPTQALRFTGNLSGPGSLQVAGGGWEYVSGLNGYTGNITANNVALILSGNQSGYKGTISGTNAGIFLADGTVLGGNLKIPRETGFQASQSGTAATQTNSPNMFGDSEEATVEGTLTLEQNALIEFDVQGQDPETGYDQVEVDQDVDIEGALLDPVVDGYTPTLGELFFIINNHGSDPISGQFANAPEGSVIWANGYAFQITYSADADTGSATGGNDVALIAVVPEPVSLAAVAGMMGMCWRRRLRETNYMSATGAAK